MRIITVNLPLSYVRAIEKLTGKNGMYPSRSELIRVAVREFIIKELETAESFKKLQSVSVFTEKYPDPVEIEEEEFDVDIDEILDVKKEEPMASEIEYKTEFQKNFQKVPTLKPPIENSGNVVDLGSEMIIDGKVFNVK